tara:strand:+ start:40 stop:465 length:426 start_codon:yes stop_codon:yes gene_type:complete
MMKITGIPSNQIDEFWNVCEEYIILAADKGRQEMTVEDIYRFCKEAKMQLWVIFDEEINIRAAVTTEIVNYPAKKVCRIVTLGGEDLNEWINHIDKIEDWAIYNDCKAMETFCRKGFIKKLENFGYEQTYSVVGKELSRKH